MKEPVYTGPKKNHAAVFIAEDPYPRLRIIYSNKRAEYVMDFQVDLILADERINNVYPCWHKEECSWEENHRRLLNYDKKNGMETIFLGYIKDTE